jgi:hypothetical protein
MNDIRQILNKYALKSNKLTIKKNATLVDTDNGRFIFKKDKENKINNIYEYLKSRSFNYYPKILNREDDYNLYEYIDNINMPDEQKAYDLIEMMALLHNKTTYFKEVDIADYKKIYEDIEQQIKDSYKEYNDLITIIESKVYMSPSEYLIARNISKIYALLDYCHKELKDWYILIKDKRRQRVVLVHNNLSTDHLIKNKDSYIISWEKATNDLPIYDFICFYQKQYLDFDFVPLLSLYESKYPLLEEERKLLFLLLSLPKHIPLTDNEFNNCKEVDYFFNYIYKTDSLIKEYYSPSSPDQEAELQK